MIPLLVALITLPGTIELALLTFSAWLPKKTLTKKLGRYAGKLAVLVPAHNEEKRLGRTLESLQNCTGSFDLFVIADNCTDRTAEVAHAYGITPFVRNEPNKKGKRYALDFAFTHLLKQDYTHFAVVDADTVVAENCFEEMKKGFIQGFEAIQGRYDILNPESSLLNRLTRIAFLAFNYLRPLGREKLGISCGLLGNGFGISRHLLESLPFREINPMVEDLSYHIALVQAGFKVHFIESARVWGEIPSQVGAAARQRLRWEGGRFREIKRLAPQLAKAVVAGEWRLLEPLLELLLLPLSYQVILLLLLLLFTSTVVFATVSLAILFLHLLAAIVLGGGGIKDVVLLFAAPFYLFWKLVVLAMIAKTPEKKIEWEREDKRDSH